MTLKHMRAVLLVVLGLVAFPRAAAACSCVRNLSWQQRLAMSDAVFVARVVGSQRLEWVDLQVRETFKGKVDPQVRIPTGASDCDYFLPPVIATTGAEFLIYASIFDGRLRVGRCLGSGTVDEKRSEVQRLRQRPK